MRFEKHVFVCINERDPDRNSCGKESGLALVKEFKRLIKAKSLNIRTNKAGCCDACDYGPTVVVYPDGTYYGNVHVSDVEEIVESHLVNNMPVQRLITKFVD